MSIDSFDPSVVTYDSVKQALKHEDRWLISRTEKLKSEVTRNLNSYDLHKACRALEEFVLDDLSRWYIRLIRDRMWKEGNDIDKLAAYRTLYDSIMTVAKLMAPFCPHITDEIFLSLDGSKDSVHMCDWPIPDLTLVDDRLETSMKMMQEIVENVTKERQKKKR